MVYGQNTTFFGESSQNILEVSEIVQSNVFSSKTFVSTIHGNFICNLYVFSIKNVVFRLCIKFSSTFCLS